jgi:hypothetical protein
MKTKMRERRDREREKKHITRGGGERGQGLNLKKLNSQCSTR